VLPKRELQFSSAGLQDVQLLPLELTSARCYGQVVYAATDVYFAHLTSADLRREIDLSAVRLGRSSGIHRNYPDSDTAGNQQ
jgi:hypothetical protein